MCPFLPPFLSLSFALSPTDAFTLLSLFLCLSLSFYVCLSLSLLFSPSLSAAEHALHLSLLLISCSVAPDPSK